MAPQVIRNILRCQQELARTAGETVRWTPEEQIHLTLQFLGRISPADVAQIQARLAPLPRLLRLSAEGVGGFPSVRRPGVIWVGLAGNVQQLEQLQADVENATRRKEERPFRPHLTIGRVREGRRPKLQLDPWKNERFGEWEVREMLLMESKLSPKGATHSVLAKFRV